MASAIFNYKGEPIKIECNKEDKMKDICNKFVNKKGIDINLIYFIVNGKKINFEFTFNEEQGKVNKDNNEMKIIVFDFDLTIYFNKDRKEIICQECKENCKIKIRDYKGELHNCNEKPKKNNILLDEKNNAEKIDESNTICNICKQNISLKKELYKCLVCKKEIYPSCKSEHEIEHKIVDYISKNHR